jgi:hypothetical protein
MPLAAFAQCAGNGWWVHKDSNLEPADWSSKARFDSQHLKQSKIGAHAAAWPKSGAEKRHIGRRAIIDASGHAAGQISLAPRLRP